MKLFKKVTVEDRLQMVYDKKKTRISRAKNQTGIIALENEYLRYHFTKETTLSDLLDHEVIRDLIQKIAGAFYNRQKNRSRITLEDFISVAYEKAWEVTRDYTYKKPFFLYQYLMQGIRHRCIDVLRLEGLIKGQENHKNRSFHEAVTLKALKVEPGNLLEMEEAVLLRISIHELINRLEPDELKVFQLYLNADNYEKVRLEDICQELGLKWPQEAKRIKERIKGKFNGV